MASPIQHPVISGSDLDPRYARYDEKKRKRMISNRESAKRSRMRKQQQLDELINQAKQLEEQNNVILKEIKNISEEYTGIASKNDVLTARIAELTDRLHSLNNVIAISGESMDTLETPYTSFEPWQQLSCPVQPWQQLSCPVQPWQLPCPVQPITASADFFQY